MLIKKDMNYPLVFLVDKLLEIMDTTMDDQNDEDRRRLLEITNLIRSMKSQPPDDHPYPVEQIDRMIAGLRLPFEFNIIGTSLCDESKPATSIENIRTMFRVEYDGSYNELSHHSSAIIVYLSGIKDIPYSASQFYKVRKAITYLWNAYHMPFFITNPKRILSVDEINLLFKSNIPFYIDSLGYATNQHQETFMVTGVHW